MNIRTILDDLRAERSRIDEAIQALEALGGNGRRGGRGRAAATSTPRRRRHMSPAARRKISEMMKARWAERKKKARAS